MTKIQAIVLDSNVFGGQSIPNIKIIEKWSSACAEHDVKLWIPEVVLHELTQHVLEDEYAYQNSVNKFSAARERMGFPRLDPIEPLQEIDIRQRIEETGAEIIGLSGSAAIAGLLDQIYLRGVGQRKGGVKTGAADSAWVRSVAEEAARREWKFSDLVIVSGDKRAMQSTVTQLQGNDHPLVFDHIGDLDNYLSEGSGEVSKELITHIIDTMRVTLDTSRPENIMSTAGISLREELMSMAGNDCVGVEIQDTVGEIEVVMREFNPWLGLVVLDVSFIFIATCLINEALWGAESFQDLIVRVTGSQTVSIDGNTSFTLLSLINDPKIFILS